MKELIEKETAKKLLEYALPTIIDEDSGEYVLGINTAYGLISSIPPVAVSVEKPRTNADRIRDMTDEELAEELAVSGCPKTHFTKNEEDFDCPAEREPCKQDCVKCWLDWLKEAFDG